MVQIQIKEQNGTRTWDKSEIFIDINNDVHQIHDFDVQSCISSSEMV